VSLLFALTFLLRIDGGTPPHKAEDPEVVKNLELLELMDETSDFELLEELSAER
jgi:hypothetical protein